MTSRIERFKKRKEIIEKNKSRPFISGVVDQDKVDNLLSSDVDLQKMEGLDYSTDLNYSLDADPEKVKVLLAELKEAFNKDKLDQLFDETKQGVIFSIAAPFGLGKVLSAYDKSGGNVTTIHNANSGVYAGEGDKYNRKEYTDTKNSDGKQFSGSGKNSVGSNFTRAKMDDNQIVQDAYTGKYQEAETTSPDHVESLSGYHKNGGFMQNSERKAGFATDEDNLALTDRSINQSMRDFDKEPWMEKETIDGEKNKDRFDINEKKLNKKIEKGRKTSEEHLPTNQEKSQYYIKSSAITGLNEGAKMGAQQAFGVLMVEFFSSSFTEIRYAFNEGLEGESLYKDIKIRLTRIGEALASKWKDVIQGFSGGFISGFISNLITTIINMFITTGKRLVRMIREGVFSILKALKLMVSPPENMSYREVMHEAMKLIAVGGVVIAGVALEEIIEKFILTIPFLVPIASMVTAVIVGSLTAIAMALVAYLIDKMDILGVIKIEQTKYILSSLDGDIQETLKRCETISEDMDVFLVAT